MRKSKKTLAILAIVAMVLMLVPVQAFAGTTTATSRLAGADRIGTALAIAQNGWANGSSSVIVVPADDANLVDALSVAPLAGQLKAPILMTYKNSLDANVQSEISTLKATNVYAVGALSSTVVNQLKAISGVTVTQIQGADRFATAAMVASKLTNPAGTFVVGYNGLADAMSAASFAAANDYAIAIANTDGTLPSSEKLVGSKDYILGGPTLVADSAAPGATRYYGADRYATNTQVLSNLSYKYSNVYVANGETLVDALAGSSLAALTNAPIVLANTTSAPAATAVASDITSSTHVTAFGGAAVVPDAILTNVANGQTTIPPVTPPTTVSISNLVVTGQTTGTGDLAHPAIATVNGGVTVSATVNGAANSNVTFLTTNSTNITAKDSSGQTLVATNLSSPTIINNDKFTATYSTFADANGNASISFTSSASSTTPFNVVVQAPFYNGTTPVRSSETRIQWGLPGTVVISPMYGDSGSPYQLNFSSGSAKGLVPVVATILPAAGSTTVLSGQSVKFTLSGVSGDGTPSANSGATANITDATGANMVGAGAYVSQSPSSKAYYNTTTDANGQAVMYVNANQPSKNGVPVVGADLEVSVQAQLVNGGGSTNQSYIDWQSFAYPSQIANVSPAQSLNDATSITSAGASTTNIQTATSGSQVTFSGTLEDAAGNPIPNGQLVVQDYNVASGAPSNNLTSDSYIPAGSTTATLFSSTAYPVLTTDANGNFSFTVSATIPVTQSVTQSSTQYYIYYVPATVSLTNGASLQSSDVSTLSLVGGSSFLSVLWQQGENIQAVGVGHNAPLSQYSTISDIPQTYSFTNLVQSDEGLYAAAYNQNAQLVAPSTGSQFDGYQLDFALTAPVGENFDSFDGVPFYYGGSTASVGLVTNPTGVPAGTYLQVPFTYVNSINYSINNDGVLTLTGVSGNSDGTSTYTTPIFAAFSTGMPAAGSGMAPYKVQSDSTSAVSGSINVNVSAKYVGPTYSTLPGTAKGGASATISSSFVSASSVASLGMAPAVQNMAGYQPLLTGNAALPNTLGLSGTAYGNSGSVSTGATNGGNASFIVAPFNTYPNLSTIPSQGITYSVTGTKNSKIYSIDGMVVTGSPQSASVNVQSTGAVSINHVPFFSAGTVAYGQDAATGDVYTLAPGTVAGTYSLTNKTTGSSAGTFTLASGTAPNAPDLYYDFSINTVSGVTTMTGEASNQGSGGSAVTFSSAGYTGPTTTALALTPVQVATVNVADEYAEAPTITVSNSLNSQTAVATTTFASSGGNVGNVVANPMSVSSSNGTQQTVTFEAVDLFGNPIPNYTFYVKPDQQGLWITQVNGTAVQSSVVMNGSTASSTVNTPVPLFDASSVTGSTYAPDQIAVSSISSGALTAYNLQTTGGGVISLQTGVDGTVNVTLADGNVTYVGVKSGTTTDEYQVGPFHTLTMSQLLLYKDAGYTNQVGAITVSWQ